MLHLASHAVEQTLTNAAAAAARAGAPPLTRLPAGFNESLITDPYFAKGAILMPARDWHIALGRVRPDRLWSIAGLRHRRRVRIAKRWLRDSLGTEA